MSKPLPDNMLQQVKQARIRHRNYEKADRLIRSYMTFINDGTIILFIGPSKSGKTTELEDLYADHLALANKIPMILVDATTIGSKFSMLHLTYRLLTELRHPLFAIDDIETWFKSAGAPKISETRARILLETGLILRECQIVAIDECQQMVNAMTENKAMHAIESFKCLMHLPSSLKEGRRFPHLSCSARRIGILSGGYSMLDDSLTSPHFKNRIAPVHLARYKDNTEDRTEFARALMTLDEIFRSDLRPGGSLIDFEELIFHGIFGCFGNVCNWVLLATAKKRANRDRYFRAEHFSETRLNLQMEETLAEIIAGEQRMETIRKTFAGYDVESSQALQPIEEPKEKARRRRPKGKRFLVPGRRNVKSKA